MRSNWDRHGIPRSPGSNVVTNDRLQPYNARQGQATSGMPGCLLYLHTPTCLCLAGYLSRHRQVGRGSYSRHLEYLGIYSTTRDRRCCHCRQHPGQSLAKSIDSRTSGGGGEGQGVGVYQGSGCCISRSSQDDETPKIRGKIDG